jgi:5-methylcytosine-specific restriction protein B
MSITKLLDIIHSSSQDDWTERNKAAFDTLFGAPDGRYPQTAHESMTVRAPKMSADFGVPFAAYIHPSNPPSGAYSGMCFVAFPVEHGPSLFGLALGTQGLAPDEAILGRPGHARKAKAICSWLNRRYGHGSLVAWAKQDPTRTDISIPDEIKKEWSGHKAALDRYGKEVYALFRPTTDRAATEVALTAFLDFLFEERGYGPLTRWQSSAEQIRSGWLDHLMPGVERRELKDLLASRRYVILQGPPGTGKTKMALDLLSDEYENFGRSIQFHANTTYENFVGGLAPDDSDGGVGLRFKATPGALMESAPLASGDLSRPYLLHIDEINRADLSKVLGEAIFLLESDADRERVIQLPYDFGPTFHRSLNLPKNLHILGTMNSADRSIAIVDVAVRRRFAFVSMWPRMSVVQQYGCPLMQDAFRKLVSIFVEHAPDEAFALVPGHSYFLELNEDKARRALKVNLVPLLQEYLFQGYVGGFAEPIRSYLQWLDSY